MCGAECELAVEIDFAGDVSTFRRDLDHDRRSTTKSNITTECQIHVHQL